MQVSGNQNIKAYRQQVFQALLNPEVLKNSIPGCNNAEFIDSPEGRLLQLTVSVNFPGVKGSHTIYLQTGEVLVPSRITMVASPNPNIATAAMKATCIIELTEDNTGTTLHYNTNAEISGKFAATPEFVIKGAAKVALDQFFKNFEKQISSINV